MKKFLIISIIIFGLVGSSQISQIKNMNNTLYKLNYIDGICGK